MKPSALIVALLACMGCGTDTTAPPARVGEQKAKPDLALMDENKAIARREERDINAWVARQGTDMTASGTGLRYKLIRDVPGDTARPEMIATINYTVHLLDGTLCYASPAGKPGSFRIEHDAVESGLHEGVQHMGAGDSAVLVIPSHLAFGLAGDQDKIPMRSTLVYHVGLVKLGRK